MAKKKSSVLTNLTAGSGAIDLGAKFKAGQLNLRANEFTVGDDRTVVVHATMGRRNIYRSFFSHDNDSAVSAVISDDGVKTRVSLYDHPKHPGIGIVNIWNDGKAEQSFEIDIKIFLNTRDPQKSIIKTNGAKLDLVGNRRPPTIKPLEVVNAFANTQAFRDFMRGSEHHEKMSLAKKAAGGVNWKCAWICAIPACGLACLFWSPLKKKKKKVVAVA